MRSTAASTSWDGATSLAGFQVSTTGRFWVSTEADVARGRPATRGDIAQTSDLGAQGVAHGVLELTAIPGRAGRLVLAGLQCGQRRSHLALETALVGRQALDDPLELPLQAAERRAGVIEAELPRDAPLRGVDLRHQTGERRRRLVERELLAEGVDVA